MKCSECSSNNWNWNAKNAITILEVKFVCRQSEYITVARREPGRERGGEVGNGILGRAEDEIWQKWMKAIFQFSHTVQINTNLTTWYTISTRDGCCWYKISSTSEITAAIHLFVFFPTSLSADWVPTFFSFNISVQAPLSRFCSAWFGSKLHVEMNTFF